MSINTLIKISTVFVSLALIASPNLYAAEGDDQQLSTDQLAEQHRKKKPKIAERDGIRAALKALRNNGALNRASRTRSSIRAARRSNRVAARIEQNTAAEISTNQTENVVAIKHVLTCETESNCLTAVEWGGSNNFNATGVLTSEGHGGEIMYHLFLRQEITPDEDTIASESSRVHEGIKSLAGIRYATWMVDLDPEGLEDNGGSR